MTVFVASEVTNTTLPSLLKVTPSGSIPTFSIVRIFSPVEVSDTVSSLSSSLLATRIFPEGSKSKSSGSSPASMVPIISRVSILSISIWSLPLVAIKS